MKRTVLADTGPLFAATDPEDAHHKRAQQDLAGFKRDRWEVAVAYPTLLEAYSLILFKLGKQTASRWLSNMAGAVLVNPGPEDYRKAVSKVQSFADQPITLFDGAVAALAERLSLPVWTYDHHFDVMQVGVWR